MQSVHWIDCLASQAGPHPRKSRRRSCGACDGFGGVFGGIATPLCRLRRLLGRATGLDPSFGPRHKGGEWGLVARLAVAGVLRLDQLADGFGHPAAGAVGGVGAVPGDALRKRRVLRHRIGVVPVGVDLAHLRAPYRPGLRVLPVSPLKCSSSVVMCRPRCFPACCRAVPAAGRRASTRGPCRDRR